MTGSRKDGSTRRREGRHRDGRDRRGTVEKDSELGGLKDNAGVSGKIPKPSVPSFPFLLFPGFSVVVFVLFCFDFTFSF